MTATVTSVPHAPSTSDEPRFAFGRNWQHFLGTLTEERIRQATESLERIFGIDGLRGKRFLDIGSGSGLFSLAAYRLGAHVRSFDYDPQSVACTAELRRREDADATRWTVERGSVLDESFLTSLGTYDIVYSWGVLHHTGEMWRAIDLASQRVRPGGTLWIAIYNDQGVTSRVWLMVKRGYVALPSWLQPAYVVVVGGAWVGYRLGLRLLQMVAASCVRLLSGSNPLRPWQNWRRDARAPQSKRGMHRWYDLIDWIGGYPFEVAKPEEIFRFLRDRGFQLVELATCGGGLGCNEFVFVREAAQRDASQPLTIETSAP